ncbi:hypothetical protein BJY24_001884 [Nocardia transvalensis]|uniref:Uncharacterized protein n=1 Tax=Nocardia transvalensis TaxID=37333 RepID=A0A7W9PBH5_9NOCA|nr:hypothetical protein [Nocardia transvalensis]MBB5913017.1 hypothetical protein [Nocardia transvalensis]
MGKVWRRRQPDDDFGLLVTVATVFDETTAGDVRRLLAEHGIRSTRGPDGRARNRMRILVFPEDARRAYDVLFLHTS